MKSRNFREGRYLDRQFYKWNRTKDIPKNRKQRKAIVYFVDPKYF